MDPDTQVSNDELKKLLIRLSKKSSNERHEKENLELLGSDVIQALILAKSGIQKSMRILVDEFNAENNQNLDFETIRGALSYYNTHVGRLAGRSIGIDKKQNNPIYDGFIKANAGRRVPLDTLIADYEEQNAKIIADAVGYNRSVLKQRIAKYNGTCAPNKRIGLGLDLRRPQKDEFIAFALEKCQHLKTKEEILNKFKDREGRSSTINMLKVNAWIIWDPELQRWRKKTLLDKGQ